MSALAAGCNARRASVPPACAPAPTNKTPQEAEPRTPLSAANTPGSCYLTENLVVPAGMSGTRLEAKLIHIDLNGFTPFVASATSSTNTAPDANDRY